MKLGDFFFFSKYKMLTEKYCLKRNKHTHIKKVNLNTHYKVEIKCITYFAAFVYFYK